MDSNAASFLTRENVPRLLSNRPYFKIHTMNCRFVLPTLVISLATLLSSPGLSSAKEWSVPVGGNAFRTQPEPGGRSLRRDGTLQLRDPAEVHSVYFHVSGSDTLQLGLKGNARNHPTTVQASIGETKLSCELHPAPAKTYPLGEIEVTEAGYVRVDLQLTAATNGQTNHSVNIADLVVTPSNDDLQLDYIQTNDGNMFYWGRRGPSVHLGYRLPKATDLTYAYSEITVPDGQDQMGTYFMANGFGEGYFGMQVNSPTERRVLFSIWSPFRTDNPNEIPDEDRVETLAKGDDVIAKDFGNEGSGGQSFFRYPWEAGKTYRFLTEVKPDGEGNTLYTSWFGDKAKNEWRLVASFRRPKTDKHLTGFHSFLENFSPEQGHLQRSAHYGNQWVCDVNGEWHEITRAKLTGDNTARGRHRLDYAGGSQDDHFFLKNCGFFSDSVALDQLFERESTADQQPAIDWDQLPR
ncbi:putative signal peptide and transmembrane protein [Rhodopirellula islandica]|uniref:Signal peptide and transmembrane protein n=1 Tax=Rhodopirellula islandica TaxID=595434 RepID=A0A0J1B9V7_RHOIS|nr:DUF3472 domain-containing protein [Rhodopirellula islandica]KLU03256.1 putative signal peptide and transmembrane protein [Rhodopirellula islandica]